MNEVERELEKCQQQASKLVANILEASNKLNQLQKPKLLELEGKEIAPQHEMLLKQVKRLIFIQQARQHITHSHLLIELSKHLNALSWPAEPLKASTGELTNCIRELLDENAPLQSIMNRVCYPLQIRFKFHFNSLKSKANNPFRPEWFFSHILQLVCTHGFLLVGVIQPCLDEKLGAESPFVVDMFLDTFVSLLNEKVDAVFKYHTTTGLLERRPKAHDSEDEEEEYDLNSLIAINHLIKESLEFDKSCYNMFQYRGFQMLKKLLNSSHLNYTQLFVKSERKIVYNRFNEILEAPDVLNLISVGLTKCAFETIDLLQSITKFCLLLDELADHADFFDEKLNKSYLRLKSNLIDIQLDVLSGFANYLNGKDDEEFAADENSLSNLSASELTIIRKIHSCNYVIKVLTNWQNNQVYFFEYDNDEYDDLIRILLRQYRDDHLRVFLSELTKEFRSGLLKFSFPAQFSSESLKTEKRSISPEVITCINWIHNWLTSCRHELQEFKETNDGSDFFDVAFYQICQCISNEWAKRICRKMYKHAEAQQLMHDVFNGLMVVLKKFQPSTGIGRSGEGIGGMEKLIDYMDVLVNGVSQQTRSSLDSDTVRMILNLRLDF